MVFGGFTNHTNNVLAENYRLHKDMHKQLSAGTWKWFSNVTFKN